MALALPALAGAQTYPEPKEPGKVAPKPKGPFHTYTVCKRGCDFRKIQAAVDKAKAGDKVKIKSGTYREAVKVTGAKKAYLRIVGNPKNPRKVVLDGRDKGQNGIFVNGADEVTIDGVMARNYKGNGFFVTNAIGYTLNHLVAEKTGTYGLYAFNSKGGTMENSEAYYVNDGAFYIGQTPQQDKPIRSIVRNVDGWGSPIGFSGTNMRYVTITKSRFYNNAAGIVPNSADGEKFAPEEDNVITDNDIFWNNFNFWAGAPFKIQPDGLAALAPVGTGIVLVGGHRNRVENNRIFGNYLAGAALIEGILNSKFPQARRSSATRSPATRSASTAPTPTAATSATTATAAGTASRATPACVTMPPTARRSPPARSAAPTRSARTSRRSCSRSSARAAQRLGQARRTRRARASSRSRSTSREARGRIRGARRRRPARGGAGRRRLGQASAQEGGGRRQLLRAVEADRQQGLDDHLGLARRGARRPRRQAHSKGPKGVKKFQSEPGGRRLHATSASSRSPAPTRSSARFTRR